MRSHLLKIFDNLKLEEFPILQLDDGMNKNTKKRFLSVEDKFVTSKGLNNNTNKKLKTESIIVLNNNNIQIDSHDNVSNESFKFKKIKELHQNQVKKLSSFIKSQPLNISIAKKQISFPLYKIKKNVQFKKKKNIVIP